MLLCLVWKTPNLKATCMPYVKTKFGSSLAAGNAKSTDYEVSE